MKPRLPDYIRHNWRRLPPWRKLQIRCLIAFHIPRNRSLIKLITTTLISFLIIYPNFPAHPLTLPASIGSSLSIALIIGAIK